MKVYVVTVTDREAEGSAAYVFESEADAEEFRRGMAEMAEKANTYWLTIGDVESPDLIKAGDAPAAAEAMAEWTMDDEDQEGTV